ncbi:AAA family ATPase [Streptomyces sp. NPDC003300]|uniref:helix-turn-helix transcriptional regulator n=1 Tax=unclassified Streptomyces TaxID=2593676 RepID=UPI0033BCB202
MRIERFERGLFTVVEFIQREAQLEFLSNSLRDVMSGSGRTVLVEGAIACGKSQTLEWVIDEATRSGVTLLCAAGSPAEAGTPLGAVSQLMDGVPPSTAPPVPPDGATDLGTGRFARQLAAAVKDMAEQAPVVIAVDDLQHVDAESLRCLLQLARLTRRGRVLMVLTQPLHGGPRDPQFAVELLRQPEVHRLRLLPLDQDGVAQILAAYTDLPAGAVNAAELYRLTGGNPLLLRACLEDCHRAVAHWPPGIAPPLAGELFGQALLTCLRRGGEDTWEVAAAVAVLGEAADTESVGRVSEATSWSVDEALQALESAGIVDGPRFRDPVARSVVRDSLDAAESGRLHREVAGLLRDQGARPSAVAAHLLAGGEVPGSWGAAVLREAAEAALHEDDAPLAIDYLELACAGCDDERVRTDIRLRLAAVLWRINPAAAEARHLPELVASAATTRLPAHTAAGLADLLISHGRFEEARAILGGLKARASSGQWGAAQAALGQLTPLAGQWCGEGGDPGLQDHPISADAVAHPSPDGSLRCPVLSPDTGVETSAERFLRVSPLMDVTLTPIVNAVVSLYFGDRLEAADDACRRFQEEADRRRAPGWRAVFAGLRADIALRGGRLEAAAQYAQESLNSVSAHNGSFFVGGPLAVLILTHTAAGDYTAAARRLNQPIPDALLKSVYGLGYLRARGHFYLATGQPEAALTDFKTAGRFAVRWGVDRPVLLPWRTDAAQALCRLEQPDRAERLIVDQLRMPDAVHPRVRGVTLRLRAQSVDLKLRPSLLARAVEDLHRSGDRLELARTVGVLGETYRELGETTRSIAVTRRALHLARECGAEPLCAESGQRLREGERERAQDLAPAAAALAEPVAADALGAEAEAKLSDSEKRVAALAACGYTNREISAKLFVTISTVEQHLTRVYRKLNITRRHQLPLEVHMPTNEIA